MHLFLYGTKAMRFEYKLHEHKESDQKKCKHHITTYTASSRQSTALPSSHSSSLSSSSSLFPHPSICCVMVIISLANILRKSAPESSCHTSFMDSSSEECEGEDGELLLWVALGGGDGAGGGGGEAMVHCSLWYYGLQISSLDKSRGQKTK